MEIFRESMVRERLGRAGPRGWRVFACACAESLLPCYRTFSIRTGQGSVPMMESTLSSLWDQLDYDSLPDGWDQRESQIAALVPDEDEYGFDSALLAANAAAALSYAVQVWNAQDPTTAVWCGRQVYEVADYLAHSQLHELDLNSAHSEVAVRSQPVMVNTIRHLEGVLGDVEHALTDVHSTISDLRARCEAWGILVARNL